MNCSEIGRILDDHRLASLSAAERSTFDAHLADCDACFQAVSAHEALINETAPRPRAGLWQAMVARVSRSDEALPPRSAPLGWQTLGGLAAMGALVLIAVFSMPGWEPAGIAAAPDVAARVADPADPEPVQAVTFVEGRDFTSMPVTFASTGVPSRVTAWLFYMWSCLYCYELDALFSEWSAGQDDSAVYVVRVPVQWNAYAALHARAFYAAEAPGVTDRVNDAFFRAIHEDGELLETREGIAAVFAGVGVGRDAFDAAFESDDVEAGLEQGRVLAAEFRIDSTPTIVVDSRYKTSPALAGSNERMLQIVDWLIARAEAQMMPTGTAGGAIRQRNRRDTFPAAR